MVCGPRLRYSCTLCWARGTLSTSNWRTGLHAEETTLAGAKEHGAAPEVIFSLGTYTLESWLMTI